jgi:hypothetical protein
MWELLIHTPAVFVTVASKGVRGYGTWKKVQSWKIISIRGCETGSEAGPKLVREPRGILWKQHAPNQLGLLSCILFAKFRISMINLCKPSEVLG